MIDSLPITRRRGDTYRIRIRFVQEDGSPFPIDGTLLLVVTEQSAPAATDIPVMELVGSVVGDAADGVADFPLTTEEADHVGSFFYEVQNTLAAGEIRTILEGPFTMIQDRAKAPIDFLFTFPGTEGAEVPLDGPFWTMYPQVGYSGSGAPRARYEIEGKRDVIMIRSQMYGAPILDAVSGAIHLTGPSAPKNLNRSYELEAVFRAGGGMSQIFNTISLLSRGHNQTWGFGLDMPSGYGDTTLRRIEGPRTDGDEWTETNPGADLPSLQWYKAKIQVDRAAGVVRGNWWAEIDPEPAWMFEHIDANLAAMQTLTPMILVSPPNQEGYAAIMLYTVALREI